MSDIVSNETCIMCAAPALADSVYCKTCIGKENRKTANAIKVAHKPKVNPTGQLVNILISYIQKEGVTLKPKTALKIRSGLHKGIEDVIFKKPESEKVEWDVKIKWKSNTNFEDRQFFSSQMEAVRWAQDQARVLGMPLDEIKIEVEEVKK